MANENAFIRAVPRNDNFFINKTISQSYKNLIHPHAVQKNSKILKNYENFAIKFLFLYESETQYGFVAKKGIRDVIALLKVVLQRVLNANIEIVACFIGF